MAEIDWLALPVDTLEVISSFLDFEPDYVRFRSVCTSWRSAAPKRPQLPWLIGHRKDDHGNYTVISFFRFSSSGDRILPIYELPESSLFGGAPCRGSSHGWLALLDFAAPSIILWNPLTRSKIQLPTLPLFSPNDHCVYSKIADGKYSVSFVVDYDTDEETDEEVNETLCFRETEHYLASQVILSSDPAASSDYVTLAVCGRRRLVAFCRAGDEVWTVLQCPPFRGRWTTQAVFYNDRFYVTSSSALYVCNLEPNPSVEMVAAVYADNWPNNESHLVESDGDLLLVLAFYNSTFPTVEYRFEVYKVCWGEHVKLLKLESLGDRALFLGRSHSFSLAAAMFPGCRANNIYHTEVYYAEEDRETKHFRIHDFGSAKTQDYESIKSLSVARDDAGSYPDWKPCGWLTPNLLP